MHGVSVGSLISRQRRSGPVGSAIVPSFGAGASSFNGSDDEMTRLRMVGMLLTDAMVMHCPLASRMRIATGQITSIGKWHYTCCKYLYMN